MKLVKKHSAEPKISPTPDEEVPALSPEPNTSRGLNSGRKKTVTHPAPAPLMGVAASTKEDGDGCKSADDVVFVSDENYGYALDERIASPDDQKSSEEIAEVERIQRETEFFTLASIL